MGPPGRRPAALTWLLRAAAVVAISAARCEASRSAADGGGGEVTARSGGQRGHGRLRLQGGLLRTDAQQRQPDQNLEDLSPEQLQAQRVAVEICGDKKDQQQCNSRTEGPPHGWKCRWDTETSSCVAVSPCEWSGNPLFHENILVGWLLSVLGWFECIEKWNNGCGGGIGTGLWCFMALFLCTCCFCLPCWHLLTSEINEFGWPRWARMPRMPEFGSWGSSEDRDLVVNDVRPGEDWRPLGAFNCEGPLRALEVKCDWWGFTTARVRISLQRDGTSVSTEDVFGPCGRLQRGDVALRRFTQTEELVSLAQAGDEFKVDYRMGGQLPASPGPAAARGRQIQGGALKIKYFEAIPEYQTETMTA